MTTRNEKAIGVTRKRSSQAMLQEAALNSSGYIHPDYICGGLTKLETLAMQIYAECCLDEQKDVKHPDHLMANALQSIRAANIFFDELEKGND